MSQPFVIYRPTASASSSAEDATTSASTSTVQPPSTQHEHLLTEIESSEGNLAGVLRPLYDSHEAEGNIMSSLEARIKAHEKTIEGMCNKHYRGFIDAVDELRRVKTDAMKMKRKVQDANIVIQEMGKKLLSTAKEMQMVQTMQVNICSTMEVLGKCIPALELYCQLEGQMEKRQYYEALKTLEQLEHTMLPQISGFSFAEMMREQIPTTRKAIEDLSRSEMTDFLTTVRESAERVGECAMHQAQRLSQLELSPEVLQQLRPERKEDMDLCPQDLVDFSPVYRSLHIFSVLGRLEVFEEYYRNARLEQLRLVVVETDLGKSKGKRMKDSSDKLHRLKSYLYQVMGFFVVEDTILHTTQGLITREMLDGWWTMVITQMVTLLRTACHHTDIYGMLKVKQTIVWFCQAVSDYGCTADKLYELMMEVRDHYHELSMTSYSESFMNAFHFDDYTPLVVDTEDKYQGVLDVIPYRDVHLEKQPFPKRFPFSASTHIIYSLLKEFVDGAISYDQGLNISQTELDECVRKSLNLLLTRTMSHCLATILEEDKLQIQELVQLWVNLKHLKEASPDLEKYISRRTRTDGEGMQVVSLYGTSIFDDARRSTEFAVIGKFKLKLTGITETASYNWVTTTTSQQPSQYIEEIIQFLVSNFQILTIVHSLTVEFIELLSGNVLKHLAAEMKSILLNPAVPAVSKPALESFATDVGRCEEFACNSGVLQVNPAHASAIFAKLRQILEMFTKEVWSDYLAEYQSRNQKYPQVHPKEVLQLVKKLRENQGAKKGVLSLTSARNKEKIKYLDFIIKKLQAIVDRSEQEEK